MIDHLDFSVEQRWTLLLYDVLCGYVQDIFCCQVQWKQIPVTCGLSVWRLSPEQPMIGPKTLLLAVFTGARCTGVAAYLWLFVWSNPTQLKPRFVIHTLKMTLIHPRGL